MTYVERNLIATSTRQSASVGPLPRQGVRRLLTERPFAWRKDVIERLNELCSLPRGWNGYDAGPVSFATAQFAYSALGAICGTDMPAPAIVPGVDGDLQIEWHFLSGDVELHVRAPNDVVAWRLTTDTDPDGEERLLSTDFTVVAGWIESLLELSNAFVGAAA